MEKLVEKIKKAWSFLIYFLNSNVDSEDADLEDFDLEDIDFNFNQSFFCDSDFSGTSSHETPLTSLHTPNSLFISDYY
jgi:hypothetical protein